MQWFFFVMLKMLNFAGGRSQFMWIFEDIVWC